MNANLNANCEACSRGPAKADGHPALRVHSLGAAGMLFKCRQCELTWLRSYSLGARYAWTRLDDRAATACVGIVMPSVGASPAAEASTARGDAMDHWLAIQRGWKQPSRRSH